MPTIKLVIRPKADIKEDGTCPIFFRITKNRKYILIATGYHIEPKYWDGDVKPGYPYHKRLTALLMARKAEIWNTILTEEEKNPNNTIQQLKPLLYIQSENGSFFMYSESYITRFSGNTLKAYRSTLNRLKEFAPSISFNEITFEFLRRFETDLRKKSNPNTIAGRMKHIRAILYAAYKDKKADRNNNPFEHYSIKWQRGSKEYLTEGELQSIREVEGSEELELCRDVFLFQFNCLGMRISDVLQIKWSDIKNGILKYKMQKTGSIKNIVLTEEALKLIGKPGKGYVFSFMDRFSDIGGATSYINALLKDVADIAGIDKHLTTHVARHTWASIAIKKIGNPRLIQRALGHSDLKTTEAYMASFSDDEVDAANKIITGN